MIRDEDNPQTGGACFTERGNTSFIRYIPVEDDLSELAEMIRGAVEVLKQQNDEAMK